MLPLLCWQLVTWVSRVGAATHVIDDADPAFGYRAIGGSWNAIANNRPCDLCTPFDASSVSGGSWHDTTGVGNSASVSFRGVSGTMFGICPRSVTDGSVTGLTYAYNINGVDQVQVHHAFCNPTQYQYQLFSVKGLDNTGNTTITVGNGANSVLLIDYFQYDDGLAAQPSSASSSGASSSGTLSPTSGSAGRSTSPAGPASTAAQTGGSNPITTIINKTTPIAPIVAPLGAIIFLLLLIIAVLFFRRRNRQNVAERSIQQSPESGYEKQEMPPMPTMPPSNYNSPQPPRALSQADYLPPSVLSSPMSHPDEPFDPYRSTSPPQLMTSGPSPQEGASKSGTASPENNQNQYLHPVPGHAASTAAPQTFAAPGSTTTHSVPPSYEKLKAAGHEDAYA